MMMDVLSWIFGKRKKEKTNYPSVVNVFKLLFIVWLCCALLAIFASTAFIYRTLYDFHWLSSPSMENEERHVYAEYITEKGKTYTEETVINKDNSEEAQSKSTETKEEQTGKKEVFKEAIGNPDLAAQRGMWQAANTLVWLTIIEGIITLLTLAYLIKNYRGQREEIEIARDANKVQRAYISYIDPIFHCTPQYVMMSVKFVNFGQTPAFEVEISQGHMLIDTTEEMAPESMAVARSIEIPSYCAPSQQISMNIMLFMKDISTKQFLKREKDLIVCYHIKNTDVFGEPNRDFTQAAIRVTCLNRVTDQQSGQLVNVGCMIHPIKTKPAF